MNIEYLKETKVVYFRRIGAYGFENGKLMNSFKHWVKSEKLFEKPTIQVLKMIKFKSNE